tara:strand:- start:1271 stop:1507 length:237 start_codon:yes stop_codon:yes gene_type:complete
MLRAPNCSSEFGPSAHRLPLLRGNPRGWRHHTTPSHNREHGGANTYCQAFGANKIQWKGPFQETLYFRKQQNTNKKAF